MIPTDSETLVLALSLVSLALAAGAIILLVPTLRRVRRWTSVFRQGAPSEAPDAFMQAMHRLEAGLEQLGKRTDQLQQVVDGCVQHVGLVRYDAFKDVGGRMSFTVALLDRHHNGVVLSILNHRDGSRAYAKAVMNGQPGTPLSQEEQAALMQALQPGDVR